jgi:hypothetical protein
MKYEVSFIEEIIDKIGNEPCGGDEDFIGSRKTKASAIKLGIKKSFQKTCFRGTKFVHEVMVRAYDEDNDSLFVAFIKNGKIIHSDVG